MSLFLCWHFSVSISAAIDVNTTRAELFVIWSQLKSYFLLRRQESQYEMTGLYSETQDDSSGDLPQDESDSLPSTITVTTNFEPVLTQSVTVSTTLTNPAVTTTSITSSAVPDTVIKCHSRQPSASLVDREKTLHNDDLDDDLSKDCGILSCRPAKMQKLARIKVSHGHTTAFLPASRINSPRHSPDFRSTSLHARDAAASTELRLHKFRHHDHREALRHSVKPVGLDCVELRDWQRHHGHFCQLPGQPQAYPRLDWNR